MTKKFWPGLVYRIPDTVDLEPLRSDLVRLGRETLGDDASEEEAVRAATGSRCYCAKNCTYRCLYQAPRHVGDAVANFHWCGNSMANAHLAAAIGNAFENREFATHVDIGAGGGRTIVEVGKVITSPRTIAVEPHAAHRELLDHVAPGAEVHHTVETVPPLRRGRVLVTLAGVLNCVSSSEIDTFIRAIATVGAGSVIATLEFVAAPGRSVEFRDKLAAAFGEAAELIALDECDRNRVAVWEVAP